MAPRLSRILISAVGLLVVLSAFVMIFKRPVLHYEGSRAQATVPTKPEPGYRPSRSAPRIVSIEATTAAYQSVMARELYRRYKSAIHTNNVRMQNALWPSLVQTKDRILELADQEATQAQSATDRTIAKELSISLRR